MATDLRQSKSAPVKPSSTAKYEAFVEAKLARARQRIRLLDMGAAGLGFLVLTLAYGLIMALLDRSLDLPPWARQAAFSLYGLGALAYLGVFVVRPLSRRVNPYYAARQIEQTLPNTKNSVVNWLDLRHESIAPAFRSAIGHQAAKDLADADLEQAISTRRTSWLGGIALGLFLTLLIFFVLGPRQFLSLINRAFAPFESGTIATRTHLTLLQPEEGDITVPIGRAVSFSVRVGGRVPDTVKLLYRYNLSDPYEEKFFERNDSANEWYATVRASEVHNGFWYKVTGGDAETPEYRVQVRSTPLLTGFDVTYHYRKYLGWKDTTSHDPNLEALRGTEVVLVARTNRRVRDGQLTIMNNKPVAAELIAADPQALRFQFVLDKDGKYTILFSSVEGERNLDPMPYSIKVQQDQPPQVEITQPGQNIELPANGILRLQGSASDDHGLAGLTLRMKKEGGAELQSKPYRNGEPLHRGDGSLPQMLEYQDFVELDKVKNADGRPAELKANEQIEYWLEAIDNCDYPGPNIGESKHFKVTIREAKNDPKQKEERQKAEQEQKQHQQKQDERLKNEKKPPQPQQNNDDKKGEPPPKDGNENGKPEQPQQKDDQPQKEPKEAPPNPDKNGQASENNKTEEEKLNDQKKKLEDAIQKQQQNQDGDKRDQKREKSPNDQTKDSQGGQADKKSDPAQNQPNEGGERQEKAGEAKGSGQPDAQPKKGETKGDNPAGQKSDANDRKTPGQEATAPKKENPTPDKNPAQGQERKGENQPSRQANDKPENGKKDEKAGGGEKNSGEQPKAAQGGQGDKNKPNNEKKGNDPATPKPEEGTQGANNKPENGQGKQGDPKKEPGSGQPENNQANSKPQEGPKNQEGKPENKQGQGDNKPQAKQPNDPNNGAKNQPGADSEKTEKKDPGKEDPKRETGTPKAGSTKSEPKEQQGPSNGQEKPNAKGQAGGKSPEDKPAPKPETNQQASGQPNANQQGQRESNRSSDNQDVSKCECKGGGKEGSGGGESKGTPKDEGSSRSSDSAPKGEGKPAASQKNDNASGNAAKKDDNKGGNNQASMKEKQGNNPQQGDRKPGAGSSQDANAQAQNPMSKDGQGGNGQNKEELKKQLEDLKKGLQSSDQKTREEAAKKLQEMMEKSQDPAARQAAKDALKKSGDQAGDKPGQEKGGQDGKKPGDRGAAEKKGQPEGAGQSGESKDKPQGEGQANSNDDAKSEKGNNPNAPNSKKPGGSGASGREGGTENSTPQVGKQNQGQPGGDVPPPQDIDNPPGAAANEEYQRKASELQLENLKKRVNKDVLKQANMTEEEYQQFLKAYQEMLKRNTPEPKEKEKLAGPQTGNRTMRNQGVRRFDPGVESKTGNLERLGEALPPLKYREPHKEFSKGLSEIERSRDKK
jgi:hypothetical protein